MSTDEKTGIQAKERIRADLRPRPGKTTCFEHEYIRHATQCLIANFDLATGKLIAPSIGASRKENDFLAHGQQTVATDPKAKWIFLTDNLNIHCSASLVQWIAAHENLTDDLGKKRRRGILENQQTRRRFLSDQKRQIRFIYTPKHCSWLNPVEVWFSKLANRLNRKGNFKSIDYLKQMILDFIDYNNKWEAKTYKYAFKPSTVVEKVKTALKTG